MDALVLTDENGAFYAIPNQVIQQCRVPDSHTDQFAKLSGELDKGDVEGFGWILTYDKSGDYLGRTYSPLTCGTTVVRLSFDVPIVTVKYP